jgi:hypothetical protein
MTNCESTSSEAARAIALGQKLQETPLVRAEARAIRLPDHQVRWTISTLGPGPIAVSNAMDCRTAVLVLSDALVDRCGIVEHRIDVQAMGLPSSAGAEEGERKFVRLSRCADPAEGAFVVVYEERREAWV